MIAGGGMAVLALAPTVAVQDPVTMPPGLADAVREAVLEEPYRVSPGKDGSWQAANPAQGMSASFSPSGLEVSGVDEEGEPWMLGRRLEGWGRGSRLTRAAEGSCEASGRRMEIRREGLTEWYVNDRRGVEQGFTVPSAPGSETDRDAPLRLILDVDGASRTEILPGGRNARFLALGAGPNVSYSGLRAWDAQDRELETRFALEGERLSILVDDAGASYPLTVDPWIWIEYDKLLALDGTHLDRTDRNFKLLPRGPLVPLSFDLSRSLALLVLLILLSLPSSHRFSP